MTVVDVIYAEFQDAAQILGESGEVSLQVMLESHLRRTLLLSAASYFELRLTRDVQGFAAEITSGNNLISSLIHAKVISRQYHSWFDWDKPNANKFFSMFGPAFKQHMSSLIAAEENLGRLRRSWNWATNETCWCTPTTQAIRSTKHLPRFTSFTSSPTPLSIA